MYETYILLDKTVFQLRHFLPTAAQYCAVVYRGGGGGGVKIPSEILKF
jgi:hypothetical protein